MIGNIVPDFPLINKSFNLSYSGHDLADVENRSTDRAHRHRHRAGAATCDDALRVAAERIQREMLDILGQALAIRHVDAGSCNGCELEIHALNNPYYNLEGLGIKLRREPAPRRHAARHRAGVAQHGGRAAAHLRCDARAQAGRRGRRLRLHGGIFGESYASCGRVANVIPVDVAVPGCPPPPIEILRGILTAVRRTRADGGAS